MCCLNPVAFACYLVYISVDVCCYTTAKVYVNVYLLGGVCEILFLNAFSFKNKHHFGAEKVLKTESPHSTPRQNKLKMCNNINTFKGFICAISRMSLQICILSKQVLAEVHVFHLNWIQIWTLFTQVLLVHLLGFRVDDNLLCMVIMHLDYRDCCH